MSKAGRLSKNSGILRKFAGVQIAMSMDTLATLFHRVSLLVFIVVLLYGYSLLPEAVGFRFNEFQKPLEAFHKSLFFYVVAGFVVLSNMLMVLFVELIAQIPVRRFNPNYFWIQDRAHSKAFFKILRNWAKGLAGSINAFFAYFVYAFVQHNTVSYLSVNINTFLYVAIMILLFWLIILPIRFSYKQY